MKKRSLQTNASGYSDPTAYQAIVEADKLDQEIINDVLEDIFKVCKDYGVFIYGDIAFVDRKTRRKARRHLNLIINNGRIGIVDYFDCWEDLRHRLGKYLEEKGPGSVAEDGKRYCVALSVDELLNLMSDIERDHVKYWN